MEIYLNERLLVKSRVFEDEKELHKAKFGSREHDDSERIWNLYTWNSKDKLLGVEDFTSDMNHNTIEAKLFDYKPIIPKSKDGVRDDFHNHGILPPDKVITISAYNSFVKTPFKKIKSIISQLEDIDILCLLGTATGPLFSHVKYMSFNLKNLLETSIEVEL